MFNLVFYIALNPFSTTYYYVLVLWHVSTCNLLLLLSLSHLFNEDPGPWIPSGVRVTRRKATARSDPECHAYFSLVNVIAMTFYMAVAMQIFRRVCATCHVKCTLYWPGGAAFSAIESEIPAAAAAVTVVNPEVSRKVDMKCSVRVIFNEIAMLSKMEEANEQGGK